MAIPLDTHTSAQPERKPGDFRRRGIDGPPIVASLTKTRQPTGRKDDLIAKCAERGLEVPPKATVADLKALLGAEPADETYGRPSGFGAALDNPHALIKWKERQVALGIAMRPELLDRLAGIDAEAERETLDGIVAQAHEVAGSSIAADRGTHVHLLTERHDRGESFDDLITAGEALGIPEPLQRQAVAKWAQFRAAMQLTALHVEVAVVHDGWRLAGTADRIDVCAVDIETPFGHVIEAGTPFCGDAKTSQYRTTSNGQPMYWLKYGPQVVAYADGVPYDVDADVRGEWGAAIHTSVALIYNYDLARALDGEVVEWLAIPVDLTVAREGARIAVEATEFAKRTDMFGAPISPAAPTAGDAPSTVAPVEVEQGAGSTEMHGSVLVDPALELANDIAGWGAELKKLLAVEWPVGVPTPAKVRRGEATWDAEQLARVQAAVNEVVGPFDDPPTERQPIRRSEPVEAPETIDDGMVLDAEVVDGLIATIKASPSRVAVNAWLRQASDAGCSWQPRNGRRQRHYEIARAAFHCAQMPASDDDEELVRFLLAEHVGDVALMPSMPVGVLMANLTIDEARKLADAAVAVCDGEPIDRSADERGAA